MTLAFFSFSAIDVQHKPCFSWIKEGRLREVRHASTFLINKHMMKVYFLFVCLLGELDAGEYGIDLSHLSGRMLLQICASSRLPSTASK